MSGSIDAVHAGAPIHCWSSPACAIRFLFKLQADVCKKHTFLLSSVSDYWDAMKLNRNIVAEKTMPLPSLTHTQRRFSLKRLLYENTG